MTMYYSPNSNAAQNAMYRQSPDGLRAAFVTLRQRLRDNCLPVPILPPTPATYSAQLWAEWAEQVCVILENMRTQLQSQALPSNNSHLDHSASMPRSGTEIWDGPSMGTQK
jgi:hypothetical protein